MAKGKNKNNFRRKSAQIKALGAHLSKNNRDDDIEGLINMMLLVNQAQGFLKTDYVNLMNGFSATLEVLKDKFPDFLEEVMKKQQENLEKAQNAVAGNQPENQEEDGRGDISEPDNTDSE